MNTARIAPRRLFPAPLGRVIDPLLYVGVGVEYAVLLLTMRNASHQHPLTFRTLLLPILYFGPLIVGLASKQFIRALSGKGAMTVEAANVCSDCITWLLLMVYGILLAFRF